MRLSRTRCLLTFAKAPQHRYIASTLFVFIEFAEHL